MSKSRNLGRIDRPYGSALGWSSVDVPLGGRLISPSLYPKSYMLEASGSTSGGCFDFPDQASAFPRSNQSSSVIWEFVSELMVVTL
jgi:hypothetical protein